MSGRGSIRSCIVCSHPMMHHDGDGNAEHFACCVEGCRCAWEYGDVVEKIHVVREPNEGADMPDLTKTRTVLDVVADGARGEGDDTFTPDNVVYFERNLDPGESLYRQTRFMVDRETWDDMGRPGTITVTIEPGDLLNPPAPVPYSAEQQRAIAACPQFSSHGHPFRYCPLCPWTERGPLSEAAQEVRQENAAAVSSEEGTP